MLSSARKPDFNCSSGIWLGVSLGAELEDGLGTSNTEEGPVDMQLG